MPGAMAGRSPRGRRNPSAFTPFGGDTGSISAWAEEPAQHTGLPPWFRVDLRVGGGTSRRSIIASSPLGRSPRGRRNPWHAKTFVRFPWSISAWAEEPGDDGGRWGHWGVDLRVGGGTGASRERRPA